MASIRTAGLTKDFGDLRAVNEIDLDLPEGGVTGFVGPNGAGKSTTIRMLLGLITPTRGDGEVLGHPIERPAAYLHRVGALIEAPAFYPTLTGKANLQEKTLPGDLAAEAEARREALSVTDPSLATTYPYLIEVVEELGASGYDYTERFERGLEHILNTIEQLRP
jgi:ABC-type multidrug transport system ATPase subunit